MGLNVLPHGKQVWLKPGLHIVVTIAEYVCNSASKRILKLPTNRVHIFHVKDQCLCSLQRCRDQAISVQLKNVFSNTCMRSLRLLWRPGLIYSKWKVFVLRIFRRSGVPICQIITLTVDIEKPLLYT